jgi:AraC-like DNA-binding protein/quercetin dioxygenase-like cupin family protein
MEKNRQKTLPVIYERVNSDFVHYSNFVLTGSTIKALHYHDKVEIGLCLSGKGITQVNEKIYNFKQGDVQSIPSGVAHLSASAKGEQSRWIWVSFSPIEVLKKAGITDPESILSLCDKGKIVCGVFDKEDYPTLTKSIEYVVECVKRDIKDEQGIAFAVGSYLIECSKITSKIKENSQYENSSSISVSALNDYISENLDDNFALSEKNLAKKLGISIASLNRLFLSQTGYPPKSFIIQSRMATAEWLLTTSNLPIIEVSLRVGYSDTSGFNRIFKRLFGITPYQYRKKLKK